MDTTESTNDPSADYRAVSSSRLEPYLAFSVLLCLLISSGIVLQTFASWADVSVVRYSLFVTFPVCAWVTYGMLFPLTKKHALVGGLLALSLALIWMASASLRDFTADGIGYQQPAADALLNGWNPLSGKGLLIWQNVYPSGAWVAQAMVASLYGTIEAARMLQVWWLFIAVPVWLAGIEAHKGALSRRDMALCALTFFCPLVVTQWLTHYVDMPLYLAGITFLGALMLRDASKRTAQAAALLMASSLLFVINVKLAGIFHGACLCSSAIVFVWIKRRAFPARFMGFLMISGLLATLLVGYRPYVTNVMQYGSLLHTDQQSFSAAQRPENLLRLMSPERFVFSMFAVTEDEPRANLRAKWPWEIRSYEWSKSGVPDTRGSGFGVWFAFGCLATLLLFAVSWRRNARPDASLLSLAVMLLIFSLLFPEGWWARYVPFAYTTPILLLLSLTNVDTERYRRSLWWLVLGIFTVNGGIAVLANLQYQNTVEIRYHRMMERLKARPQGSVYLVPPGQEYRAYNSGYVALQRRLHEEGIETTVRVDAPCDQMVEQWTEFKICVESR